MKHERQARTVPFLVLLGLLSALAAFSLSTWAQTPGTWTPTESMATANAAFARTLSPVAPAFDDGTNLIVNGDFEMGNTGFTSVYLYGLITEPGTYVIGSNPSTATGHWYDWCNFGDHTTGTGLMFIANGGSSVGHFVWSQAVTVDPNTQYNISLWGATINTYSGGPAQLVIMINGQALGGVTLPANCPAAGGSWVNLTSSWNSGTNTTAVVTIRDRVTAVGLNDFVMDDISLTAIGSSQ